MLSSIVHCILFRKPFHRQRPLNNQPSASTLTYTIPALYTISLQYSIFKINQSENHIIQPIVPTTENNPNTNIPQHNTPQPHNNAVLRLGTALPRQIHRRLLQTRQPSIITTKNIVPCSAKHDFGIHRSPANAQHNYWQNIKSRSNADKRYLCGTLSEWKRASYLI